MQPRSLDQVISSLGSIYDPQVQSIQKQQADIPGQVAAEEQGLQAKQQTAFGDILNGARNRGVGLAFGGIPLADQARYTADTYLPALANLHTAQKQQQQSLSDAINAINERRATQGQSIYEGERNFAEQQRQFNENLAQQRASAASSASSGAFPSFGYSGGTSAGNPKSASAVQRGDGGFNYTDANGNAISAAAYAAAKGVNFRDVLSAAAKAGDKGAATALGFVGNDYGYDPRKVNSQQLASLYNSLVWGTGKQATYGSTIPMAQPNNPTLSYAGMNTPANGAGSGHPNIFVR
jgi:hypothetical protein